MTRLSAALAAAALIALACLGAACETHSCQNACSRVYYECNGTGITPIQPGLSQDDAFDQCVTACSRALYTTSRVSGEDVEDIGEYDLQTSNDALKFIDCVEKVDLGDPQCVEDYDSICPWIRW